MTFRTVALETPLLLFFSTFLALLTAPTQSSLSSELSGDEMDLLRSPPHFSTVRFALPRRSTLRSRSQRIFTVRSSFPFPSQKAEYHRELQAAVEAVERACRLCVHVQSSLFSSEGRVVEKNDQTPVTVADFGVQALVSLELGKSFPSIPLVAEEDSGFVRQNNLTNYVATEVRDKASSRDKPLTDADVLEAIDRGGKDAYVFGPKPETYWLLDPIDGTRGFLKGSGALYVVGLALVVEGEVVLGVMGCPNWKEESSNKSTTESVLSGSGILMIAHSGCGTWVKELQKIPSSTPKTPDSWKICFVDECSKLPKARFCISDTQTWDSLPVSTLGDATTKAEDVGDNQILLLPAFCGSLCKYIMVASGRASVFIARARVEKTTKAWDHAVGMICVHEAGGKVSDWEGKAFDLAADETERRIISPRGGFLVSNAHLHDQLLDTISSGSSALK